MAIHPAACAAPARAPLRQRDAHDVCAHRAYVWRARARCARVSRRRRLALGTRLV